MPRLIDADVLYSRFENEYKVSYKNAMSTMSDYWRGICDGVDWGCLRINKAPTIEAEPVRHRSWVIKTHDDGYGEFNVKHCPDCDAGLPPEFEANYCYWCGAKMDGGEKE